MGISVFSFRPTCNVHPSASEYKTQANGWFKSDFSWRESFDLPACSGTEALKSESFANPWQNIEFSCAGVYIASWAKNKMEI
jgi:hypothetical protein